MIYRLVRKITLPINIDEAWDFFSSPENLATITPDDMGFEIQSGHSKKMFTGQIITYTVRPLLNIPMIWVTEITHVEDKHYFIDEQRFGPYSFWHHKHFFETVEDGVKCTDILDYKLPLGFLGRIVHALFVKRRLNSIFDYRHDKLKALFSQTTSLDDQSKNIL